MQILNFYGAQWLLFFFFNTSSCHVRVILRLSCLGCGREVEMCLSWLRCFFPLNYLYVYFWRKMMMHKVLNLKISECNHVQSTSN